MFSKIAIIGASVIGIALVPAAADATPPTGVTGTILYQVTIGHKDYILREITIQPGGSTGWHYHDGTLYAVVKAGTLTHDDADCTTVDTYQKGDAFIEPSGANHVHIGRNIGTTPIVLDVLYVDPAGSPLSEDAPDPGCKL